MGKRGSEGPSVAALTGHRSQVTGRHARAQPRSLAAAGPGPRAPVDELSRHRHVEREGRGGRVRATTADPMGRSRREWRKVGGGPTALRLRRCQGFRGRQGRAHPHPAGGAGKEQNSAGSLGAEDQVAGSWGVPRPSSTSASSPQHTHRVNLSGPASQHPRRLQEEKKWGWGGCQDERRPLPSQTLTVKNSPTRSHSVTEARDTHRCCFH